MSRVKLPEPGVSNIGEDGKRTPTGIAPPKRGRLAPTRDREPLKNVEGARRIDPRAPPAGVQAALPDIVEIPIKTKRSARTRTTFTSADGETYTIQTHDEKGRPLPHRNELCLFLSIREMNVGGDPFTVFDAFKLRIEDVDGKLVYPVPGTQAAEPAEPKGFTLGED